MIKKRIILCLSLFLALSVTLIFSAPTDAATTPNRQLSISPLRTELVIEAGTSKTGTLTIYNTGKDTLNIQMSTELFSVTNPSYDYAFNKVSPLIQWVHFSPANFELAGTKSQEVTYTIEVPITADHGGKYFSLFASSNPSQTASPINTVERVGSLIYLTIPGNITKTGSLVSLRSPLATFGNATWSATIQNSGTAHFRSQYASSLRTLWGSELKKTTGSALILPNSIRLISDELIMPQWLGIYTVRYSFGLGDNPNAERTKLLIYMPPSQTISFVLLLIFALLSLSSLKKRKKSKKDKKTETTSPSEE